MKLLIATFLLIVGCSPPNPSASTEREEEKKAVVQPILQPEILAEIPEEKKINELPDNAIVSQVDVGISDSVEEGPSLPISITGTVTFDMIDNSLGYWDYENTTVKPAKNVKVVLSSELGSVIDVTFTDESGDYVFNSVGTPGKYFVVAVTETKDRTIRVEDNTQNNAVFGVNSVLFDQSEEQQTIDLHASSGWEGQNSTGSYTSPRVSAPFAIIHFLQLAEVAFKGDHAIPGVIVNWSPSNRSVDGDKALGEIKTAHWDGTELYLRGEADVNADEYDPHVMIHEWMHYFQDTIGRSDSPGGSHPFGANLDPRLAFSEGLANAAATLTPGVGDLLIDVYGQRQGLAAMGLNIEDRTSFPSQGWYSELAVSYLIHDFFDEQADVDDTLALEFMALASTLKEQANTGIPSTIFSFLYELKELVGSDQAQIDQMTTSVGISNVGDRFGSAEIHDGGFAGSLPPVRSVLLSDEPVSISMQDDPAVQDNRLESTRMVTFEASTLTTSLHMTLVTSELRIRLLDRWGILQDWEINGSQSINFDSVPGQTYTLVITLIDEADSLKTVAVALEAIP
jgi:hypothetical protein